ncbi:hypothetical protein U1Q18_003704 [Sarracenia purpurea var. burkii]
MAIWVWICASFLRSRQFCNRAKRPRQRAPMVQIWGFPAPKRGRRKSEKVGDAVRLMVGWMAVLKVGDALRLMVGWPTVLKVGDARPVVLAINSEEEGWGETRGSCDLGSDDCDWISEPFGDKAGGGDIDDSSDVVFVGEVMLKLKPSSGSSSVAESDLDDLLAQTTGEISRGAKEIWASQVAAPRIEMISCY